MISDAAAAVCPVDGDVIECATELYDRIVDAVDGPCHDVSQDDIVREKAQLLSDLGSLYAVDGNDDAARAAFAKAATLLAAVGTRRDQGRLARRRAGHARHQGASNDWLTWTKQAYTLLAADGSSTAESVEAALDLADALFDAGMLDDATQLLSDSLDLVSDYYGSASIECGNIRERLAAAVTSTRFRASAIPARTLFTGQKSSATS